MLKARRWVVESNTKYCSFSCASLQESELKLNWEIVFSTSPRTPTPSPLLSKALNAVNHLISSWRKLLTTSFNLESFGNSQSVFLLFMLEFFMLPEKHFIWCFGGMIYFHGFEPMGITYIDNYTENMFTGCHLINSSYYTFIFLLNHNVRWIMYRPDVQGKQLMYSVHV